jgi:hypothetical protein
MKTLTKTHVLRVARRAYGPDFADSVAEHLPERLDLDNAADADLLFRLGLTPDRLFNALGGEM